MLPDIAIGGEQGGAEARVGVEVVVFSLDIVCHLLEHVAAELHYRAAAAEVGAKGELTAVGYLLGDVVSEQVPIGVAPAVDTLLHIAYHHAVAGFVAAGIRRQCLLHQRTQVVPLQAAGVLKLVDHKMLQSLAYALIYERSVGLRDYLPEQLTYIRHGQSVELLVLHVNKAEYVAENTCGIEVGADEFGGGVVAQTFALPQLYELSQVFSKAVVVAGSDLVCRRAVFRHAAVNRLGGFEQERAGRGVSLVESVV